MNYGPTPASPGSNTNLEASVRAELQRILASQPFEDAERLQRFLAFVVEETLAGRGDRLKESVIGVEIFGRDPGYDPKVEPIVRVQARRLRSKIELWYQDGGKSSSIRIDLPKGGYTPEWSTPPAPVVQATVEAPDPRRRLRLYVAAGVVGLAVLTIVALRSTRVTNNIPGSRLFTAYPGYQTTPAFSPDGRTIAFTWGGTEGDNIDIYIQRVDADSPKRLTTSPAQERRPAWLPDGEQIGFLRDEGPDRMAVIVVPVLGAGERRVAEIHADSPNAPRIDWSRDGRKLYTSERPAPGAPLQIVEIALESGVRRVVTPPISHETAVGTPGDDEVALSPDGKWIAFRRRSESSVADVYVVPVAGGEARLITHDRALVAGIAWTRHSDALIVSSQRQSSLLRLWRFPLDGGAPACLTDAALSASSPAVSRRDGQIAFASRFLDANIWRIDLTGGTQPQRLIASNLYEAGPRYSPRGDRIAFRSNRTGNDEIWIADATGRSPVRVTNIGGPVTGSPAWSPDGQFLAFDSRVSGNADVFLIPAGGGKPRRLTDEKSNEVTPSFSGDGKWIYFASDRSGVWQIWKQPLAGGAAVRITSNGGFAPAESADGRWLYYAKHDVPGIFRIPLAGGTEEAVLPSLPLWLWGGWGVSGDRLISLIPKGGKDTDPADLRILDIGTRNVTALGGAPFPSVRWDGSLSVSPDGHYALVSALEREGSEIHVQPEQ